MTTVNSTLLIKYTCTVYVCVMRGYIHRSGTCVCIIIIITHVCCVQYTALDFIPVVVQEHIVTNMES